MEESPGAIPYIVIGSDFFAKTAGRWTMSAKLIEPARGDERTREISITKEEFLIGRGLDCDLRVNDEDVSRHHCLIRVRGVDATVSDLGSRNGTFINGKRVLSQLPIITGDALDLGKCRFVVDLGDRPEGALNIPDATDPLATTKKIEMKHPKS
jgi:pSer/pThr/pTyr-binding forkhead associated (FHA) protein